jgi:serine/threonine-protein kinase RsbW
VPEPWGQLGDQVRLEVPADPTMVRLARITASSVLGRMGFTYDEVEDVRLAVDELCWAVAGPGAKVSSLVLVCTVLDEAVQFEGHVAGGPDATGTPVLSSMTARILDRLVDSYEILAPDDAAGAGFRMVKRRS